MEKTLSNKKMIAGIIVSAIVMALALSTQLVGAKSKVSICHVPPGNDGKAITLKVGMDSLDSHLGSHEGDYAGNCKEKGDRPEDLCSITGCQLYLEYNGEITDRPH